jgi:hypothetical protein
MTVDDDALLSYEVLCSALRYVGHFPTSGSWQNQGWRATSHQVSKMNQVKPLTSVENNDTCLEIALKALTFLFALPSNSCPPCHHIWTSGLALPSLHYFHTCMFLLLCPICTHCELPIANMTVQGLRC